MKIVFIVVVVITLLFYHFVGKYQTTEPINMHTNGGSRIPVVYRDDYNIRLNGMEKFHSFDTEKYGHIADYLKASAVSHRFDFIEPPIATENQILGIHTRRYIDSLRNPSNVARIAELPILESLSATILKRKMLDPMLYASGGTILAAKLAIKHGLAINLSGGYHHAESDSGGGWCYYNDIMMAVMDNLDLKILIIDLDAHQCNGIGRIKLEKGWNNVFIFDMYNKDVYPHDIVAREAINVKIELRSGVEVQEYLTKLKEGLESTFSQFSPDLIIYNAGSDVLRGDPLGGMNLSPDGMIKRDSMVWEAASTGKIPLVFLLSGGYQKNNARIISESIRSHVGR
jgi:histone deacetylase 11